MVRKIKKGKIGIKLLAIGAIMLIIGLTLIAVTLATGVNSASSLTLYTDQQTKVFDKFTSPTTTILSTGSVTFTNSFYAPSGLFSAGNPISITSGVTYAWYVDPIDPNNPTNPVSLSGPSCTFIANQYSIGTHNIYCVVLISGPQDGIVGTDKILCLGVLYIQPAPTPTPAPTSTPTSIPTSTPTPTSTPIITPTPSTWPTPTNTPPAPLTQELTLAIGGVLSVFGAIFIALSRKV